MSLIELFAFLANIILGVSVLPSVIYDKESGIFKGYLRPVPILCLLVAAFAGWLHIAIAEAPRVAPWQYSVFSVIFVVIGSRFMVEGIHRRFHGNWLRKEGVWLLRK